MPQPPPFGSRRHARDTPDLADGEDGQSELKAAGRPHGAAAARRLSWGFADQALSSCINFALGIVVAASVSATDFGLFALVFSTYALALAISRGLCTDPLAVRYSTAQPPARASATSSALGAAIAVGVALGALCGIAGAVHGGREGAAFSILGLTLPGLLLQDGWRYAFFAAGRGGRAFLNDLAWSLLLFPGLLLAGSAEDRAVTLLVFVWGVAAAVAAVLGGIQARVLPRPAAAIRWVRNERDLGPTYLAEHLGTTGVSQLVLYGVGAVSGLAAVGAIRAGVILLGPVNVFAFGARLAAVPEAARILESRPAKLPKAMVMLSVGLAVLGLCWTAVLILAPSNLGEALVGPIWRLAQPVLLPLGAATALVGTALGAVTGLRALAAAGRTLSVLRITSPFVFGGGILGAAVGGGVGAAWGLATGYGISAFVWWYHFRKAYEVISPSGIPGPDS